jgi:hypothetical protein
MHNLPEHAPIVEATQRWLEQVVIGLNLCPFAAKPFLEKQVRISVTACRDTDCLLNTLQAELEIMAEHRPQEIETTLLVVPDMLADFYDYNDFLDQAEALLDEQGWTGHFQLASFHPHYQFADTEPEDCENLTNRAPYPILHLIREASLEKVLEHYPHPEQIPERNIERVCNLDEQQKAALFPYLFSAPKTH